MAGVITLALVTLNLHSRSLAQSNPRPFRAFVPIVASEPPPEPPRLQPYVGPVASIVLESARISGLDPIEVGDTVFVEGVEYFGEPTRPERIMFYPRFGRPGFGGSNTIFAAHVNYVNFGLGPFAHLTEARIGDTVHVAMDNGATYRYLVKSVHIVLLAELNMDDFVYPPLDETTERVTLMSCAGTFIPGTGGYDSRIFVVAERVLR